MVNARLGGVVYSATQAALDLYGVSDATAVARDNGGVLINGNANFTVRMAQCCSPVPGDEIVGYISRGRGVSVHRKDCPNVKGMEDERLSRTTSHTTSRYIPQTVFRYSENAGR